ncbi:MAG: NYN domain-containing protein [Planctomycetota bacterium]
MGLLIDGYNLLHVTGLIGSGPAAGSLQQSREALLHFLAESIDEAERPRTTIVFDAAEAPPGLPRVVRHDGIIVRYASDYPDADTLLEELIAADDSPRKLLVVSSDHRVQRAARRRRARFEDSDVWYRQLWQRRHESSRSAGSALPEKPVGPLSPAEVRKWMAAFSTPEAGEPERPETPAPRQKKSDLGGIFPPGYGDDLLN